MAKTIGYLRVSTEQQNLENQKLAILEYGQKNKLKIASFIGVEVSSRKDTKKRKIDEVFDTLKSNDTLIVSKLSRLGRSVGEIARIVDEIINAKFKLICIKENIIINGKRDLQSKVMITMFSLFAEIERDLISERTKEGLAAARAKGKLLGRPKGKGKSKLDKYKNEIEMMLQKGMPKTVIARTYGVSRPNLYNFIRQNGISI